MRHTRFWRSGITVLAAALFAGATAAAPTNLVDNGGFESGLSGWSTSGFFAEGFDYGIDDQSHSGANAFYGGALDTPGFLSQSIATVSGQAYHLTLWLLSDGFLPNQFQVLVNGMVELDLADILLAPYQPVQLSFLATGATTLLDFGFRSDSGLLHVDDIVVSQVVPEPATAALLGLGGALFLLRRRASAGRSTAGSREARNTRHDSLGIRIATGGRS